MFNEIVTIANDRVVTAADWQPYVGQSNWLSFDRAEPLGTLERGDEPWVTGVVYEFDIIGIFADSNKVRIELHLSTKRVRSILMDADELAIRMEDS